MYLNRQHLYLSLRILNTLNPRLFPLLTLNNPIFLPSLSLILSKLPLTLKSAISPSTLISLPILNRNSLLHPRIILNQTNRTTHILRLNLTFLLLLLLLPSLSLPNSLSNLSAPTRIPLNFLLNLSTSNNSSRRLESLRMVQV